MSIIRISKIVIGFTFLMIPLLMNSCDDFQDETYEASSQDKIGIEALTEVSDATTIKPAIITWSDSLQIYTLINTGTLDTLEIASFTEVVDSLLEDNLIVEPIDSRIIQSFDTAGVVLSIDTVLLASVDNQVDQLKSDPAVDSIHVSVPVPNYLLTVSSNTSGYSVLFNPGMSTTMKLFMNNFVNLRIIEPGTMDSTDIIPADIPLELLTAYYTTADNEDSDPILKSYVSIDLENKNYIIQFIKTEATVKGGKVYFSLTTE